jgi:hypothetical protein
LYERLRRMCKTSRRANFYQKLTAELVNIRISVFHAPVYVCFMTYMLIKPKFVLHSVEQNISHPMSSLRAKYGVYSISYAVTCGLNLIPDKSIE